MNRGDKVPSLDILRNGPEFQASLADAASYYVHIQIAELYPNSSTSFNPEQVSRLKKMGKMVTLDEIINFVEEENAQFGTSITIPEMPKLEQRALEYYMGMPDEEIHD